MAKPRFKGESLRLQRFATEKLKLYHGMRKTAPSRLDEGLVREAQRLIMSANEIDPKVPDAPTRKSSG